MVVRRTAEAAQGGAARRSRPSWSAARLAACVLAVLSIGASRPRYGGTVRVVSASPVSETDPQLADTPQDAAISALRAAAVCRLHPSGRLEWTGVTASSSHPLRWALTPLPTARWTTGEPMTAASLAQSLARVTRADAASPYRALLHPLRGEGKTINASADRVELTLRHPWPDLERSLCHPQLAPWQRGVGVGPFAAVEAGAFAAFMNFARGRPYVDRLEHATADERRGPRLLELGQAEVLLGGDVAEGSSEQSGPALFATYLVLHPRRAPGELRAHVEAGIDRADLVRFFVPSPAVPMTSLLPPALMPQGLVQRPAPPAPVAARDLVLLFDAAAADHRAVAERLQVRLHGMGFRIAPQALSRKALRARWAAQDFDILLMSVLLPPAPGPALAIAVDLAGRRDRLAAELPPIGAIADTGQRDAFARNRAEVLLRSLPVVPLYARAIRVQAPRLPPIAIDAFGIPQLEDVSLPRVAP